MNLIDRYTIKTFGLDVTRSTRPVYVCNTCQEQVKVEELRKHHEEHKRNE